MQLDKLRPVNQKAEMSTTIPITSPEKNGKSSDDSWSYVALFGLKMSDLVCQGKEVEGSEDRVREMGSHIMCIMSPHIDLKFVAK
jgi:hypothetical protein